MLPPDDKIALILGGSKPSKEGDLKAEPEAESAGDEGMKAAADDLMSALHAKDSAGVMAALKAAFDMCSSATREEA